MFDGNTFSAVEPWYACPIGWYGLFLTGHGLMQILLYRTIHISKNMDEHRKETDEDPG